MMKGARSKAGQSPGTPIFLGERRKDRAKITVYDFDAARLEITEVEKVETCFDYRNTATTTWINLDGISSSDSVVSLGHHYGINPLSLEDILNTNHRPKLDEFDHYLFIVGKMIYLLADHTVVHEHLAVAVGENFVLSFQEEGEDVFAQVRKRLENSEGRLRRSGPDYLAYALLDAMVDNYFIVLEYLEEQIEALDDTVVKRNTGDTLEQIFALKRDVTKLRRAVSPLREVVASLLKGESRFMRGETRMYLRDLQDHVVHAIEAIESAREDLSQLTEIYLSNLSQRMNEVMKVLTMIATIFIPLSFIAGIYGMNFDHMPELRWTFGYPLALLVMATVALIFLIFFRRKEWL